MATVLTTFGFTALIFLVLWLASLRQSDASIVDIYWGPGFAVIAWIAFGVSGNNNPYTTALCLALTVWGLRLGWHILQRHNGEDARYKAMRAYHGEAFGRKSLWTVFGLQAVIQWLASSPILVATIASPDPVLPIFVLGMLVFLIGFLLEWTTDHALASFKAGPANKGKLLTTGLHKHIRHPNYLGEIILQQGIGLMAFGITLNPLVFVGPILMATLIAKLSGIPLLEEHLSKREGFAEWKTRSGALWPKWK